MMSDDDTWKVLKKVARPKISISGPFTLIGSCNLTWHDFFALDADI